MTKPLTCETINAWADGEQGPVALHLKQELLPVEGKRSVIFPPTYADIGYNIDSLSDGTKVALIDSVGSQANRMEPLFKREPYSSLVPQIEIELRKEENDDEEYTERRSLLDLAHRGADAVVYSCPELAPAMEKAFRAFQRGNAQLLCQLAPTSLVFGFWDSRGGSNEKRPRLVRSIIRAWDVQTLHAAAQFNSIWKALDDDQKKELENEAEAKNTKLSKKGFADAPAIFRRTRASQYVGDSPNPEARVLGGVLVKNGRIERDVTVNLVALRAINGGNREMTKCVRRYLLALTLIAATAEIDLFLREGCHLCFADDDRWNAISRRAKLEPFDLSSENAKETLLNYAKEAVRPFREEWPEKLSYKFDLKEAKKLLAKKTEDEEGAA